MSKAWTKERRALVMRRVRAGDTYEVIAADMGTTRSAIGGLVFRERNPDYWKKVAELKRLPGDRVEARHIYHDLPVSKTPFAPDSTCPDFAWDDDHIAAVVSVRPHGFPVAFINYSRRRAA